VTTAMMIVKIARNRCHRDWATRCLYRAYSRNSAGLACRAHLYPHSLRPLSMRHSAPMQPSLQHAIHRLPPNGMRFGPRPTRVGGAPVWQLQANSMHNTAPIGFTPMVSRFGLRVVKPTVHRREAGWGRFDILHGSVVSKPMLTRRKAGMGRIVTVLLSPLR
jgi:hypothetical protein